MNFGLKGSRTRKSSEATVVSQRSSLRGPWFALILLLITAIGAGARLYELDRPSFWGDELRTIGTAGMSISDLRQSPRALGQLPTIIGLRANGIDVTQIDPDRPHEWKGLGINEWNARIGACIIGILTIPVLILASRRILGTSAALMTGLLLALAPWHIVWSQAARFYTIQFLFYTLCLIWYFQWRNDRKARLLLAAIAALVLAFLSQPTALLALAVMATDLSIGVLRNEVNFTRIEGILIGIGGGICVLLLTYYISANPGTWGRFVAFNDDNGYHYPSTLFAGTLYMVQLPVVAVACLSALWLTRRDRPLAQFLLIAALAPLLILSVWSIKNFVGLRYVLITLWWWLALAGIGLAALYDFVTSQCTAYGEAHADDMKGAWQVIQNHALALAPMAVVIAGLLVPLYAYYEDGYGYRGRWREAFDYAMSHRTPDEVIATTANQKHVAQYYCGEEHVQEMNWTLGEMLDEFHAPTWIVFHAETSVRGTAQEWARDGAEMRAVFDLRVPQPIEKVSVYRFVPELAEARRRGLRGSEMSHRSD